MKEKLAEGLIRVYNGVTSQHNGYSRANINQFMLCLNIASFEEVCNAMSEKTFADIEGFVKNFLQTYKKPEEKKANTDQILESLVKTVSDRICEMEPQALQSRIQDNITEYVKGFIADTYGTIQRKVELVMPKSKVVLEGAIHHAFETVLAFVVNDEPVYLVGPAGTGKNVICNQVAKSLGLDFYFSNAITQEYKLTGFTDAMGNFHETQFYKAFKNGGLFMLDEMDGSIPDVLIILNAAIANRYFDFPAPIGKVEAHKDFRIIAAGNTFGYGASAQYTGRKVLDGASLDRFALVEVDYDKAIELACADGDELLVKFCNAVRKGCQKIGLEVIVSYRSITRIKKLQQMLSLEDTLKSCILKGMSIDDLNALAKEVPNCGKYTDALKGVISKWAF